MSGAGLRPIAKGLYLNLPYGVTMGQRFVLAAYSVKVKDSMVRSICFERIYVQANNAK